MNDTGDLKWQLESIRADLAEMTAEMGRAIVGQEDVVRLLITAVFADGHILLEGLPGLGKTLMVTTLRDILDLDYGRVQFTPDLMPADITGTNIIESSDGGEKTFRFQPGPIFTNLLLADEINRASPKTQSALLQAMQEREVTVLGVHHRLDEPFHTVATQNPIEIAGTYPLPEAQLDRFLFKVIVTSPNEEDLVSIAERTTGPDVARARKVIKRKRLLEMKRFVQSIPVASPVMRFAARLVLATHPGRPDAVESARRYVRYGASPRGLQALVSSAKVAAARDGRFHVSAEDVLDNLLPALRHRVVLNFEGELQRVDVDGLLRDLARAVPMP